jgi:acyl-CoA thioester hydrolase
MGRFITHVPLRWTDQDAFGHLNNARLVTVLEEARVALFFACAEEAGLSGFEAGCLITSLEVRYLRQVPYERTPLRVAMWVSDIRAASFTVHYELWRGGDDSAASPALTATTTLAMFDLEAQRVRRLTAAERGFITRWTEDLRPGRPRG